MAGGAAMIVDAHCHAGLGDVMPDPLGDDHPDAALRRYTARARHVGIGHTLLMAPPSDDYPAANRHVARIVQGAPQRWTGIVFVGPRADAGRIDAMVTTAVDAWGFRAIKVHWRDGPMTDEVARAAQARALPVVHDPGGDVDQVAHFADRYPDVAWVVPHLSSFADDWRAQTRFVDLLERRPNVHTDTSGVRYVDVLLDAVRRAGAHKVLFGTDGPYLHPAAELAKVRGLGLARDDLALVLAGNVRRLVARVRRAPATTPVPV
ncbi:amidohydrolase family protein [Cellulomonas sp. S1-8]|uniref:amidohydrolase family protein n=1 Tax=Cellulomonas sp. S1-8 TaxID=2904790 RepID=UPI002244ABE5|nr:amidohydrolase family protein [Cellulomonas sp. S1-8]UZN03469.1 amidohydrolase family protein [Cellulomonas sp. S1-8]